MTDYDRDRGAYSPSAEAPLAFDARKETQGGGRPPFALIISALILLILVLALIFYYRSGVRQAGQPPVVGAPLGQMSSAAPASAQPEQEATGLQVYGAEQGAQADAAPTFAPPPEQPLPREPAPAVTAAPVGAPPSAAELRPAAPAPSVPSVPAAAAPAQTAAAPAPAPQEARPAPKPAAAAPAPKPAARPAPAAAASGGTVVQIGALASPALADKAWNEVARKLPADMAGRTKRVEPVTTSTGATLYRAYIGGFESRTEAQAFCAKLKGIGGACIVR